MKKTGCFLFSIFFFSLALFSQEIHEFSYDASGNRIFRQVIHMGIRSAAQPLIPAYLPTEEESGLEPKPAEEAGPDISQEEMQEV